MDAARKGLSAQRADIINTLYQVFSVAVTCCREFCALHLICRMERMQSINTVMLYCYAGIYNMHDR